MERLNESLSAQKFMVEVLGGIYPCERSKNTEVNYGQEKQLRDTAAVKTFVKSELFASYKNMD